MHDDWNVGSSDEWRLLSHQHLHMLLSDMSLILLLLILSVLLCGAFFCGFVIGSFQGKQMKHESMEIPIIYLSPKGECYHTLRDCQALKLSKSSSLSSKRACSFCAK